MINRPKAPKHGKTKIKRNKMTAELQRYHNWVRDRGCEITGKPCSPHHEPYGSRKDHRYVVGLDPDIHQHGPYARHKMSLEAFNEHWGIDIRQMAIDNWEQYNEGHHD